MRISNLQKLLIAALVVLMILASNFLFRSRYVLDPNWKQGVLQPKSDAKQNIVPNNLNVLRQPTGQILSLATPAQQQQQQAVTTTHPPSTSAPPPPPTPQPTQDPFDLKIGDDYFADYNIFNISDPDAGDDDASIPNSPRTGERYLFHYVNRTTSKFKFRWLSKKPRVALVPNFLSDAECDQVVADATPTMRRSMVARRKGEEGMSGIDDVRTSSQTWLQITGGIGQTIANRIFEFTGFQPGSSEILQVLRYEKGQKYNAHLDYFSPQLYGPQKSNRAVTVFLYLRTVEEGGHTWFPDADGKPLETRDYVSCKRGLGYKPKKGNVVIFYDMTPTGGYDESSLHGACPVIKGEKWGGTLWLRMDTPDAK